MLIPITFLVFGALISSGRLADNIKKNNKISELSGSWHMFDSFTHGKNSNEVLNKIGSLNVRFESNNSLKIITPCNNFTGKYITTATGILITKLVSQTKNFGTCLKSDSLAKSVFQGIAELDFFDDFLTLHKPDSRRFYFKKSK